VIALLLALYPAQWRRRYGEEFAAVLESRPIGPFDVLDVLLGALDARLARTRLAGAAVIDGPGGGHLMMLRIGGIGGIAGGILWFVGIATTSAGLGPALLWYGCLTLGTLGLLLALAGLSAFQAHREPRLAWAAFAIPGLGTILSLVGLAISLVRPGDGPVLAGWSSWGIWALGLLGTVVGSLLFAVATIRAAVLSTRAAKALAISAATLLLVGLGLTGDGSAPLGVAVMATVLGAFAASWAWLGISALRRGPIRAIATA
jgi:hypothetical protein